MVENAVLIVERWILFRLRKRLFTSLTDLNDAIAALLSDLNARPFQKMSGCRRSHYETLDLPALRPLPAQIFEYTEFNRVRVGMNGRFEVDGTPYNTPFMLSGQIVDLRITAATVEVLHKGQRVASHQRGEGSEPVIDPSYLRAADRHFGQWSAEPELAWADSVGIQTRAYLERLFGDDPIREQGYRSALSFKRMQKEFGNQRLEAACGRAIAIGANSITSVRSILRTGLDQQGAPDEELKEATFDHPNVRGSDYYH